MNTNKAQIVGLDAVLEWFENNSFQPFFSVWVSPKVISYQNIENSEETAKEKLKLNIEAGIQNGFYQNLILKLHNFKDKDLDENENCPIITNATPYYASVVFKCLEYSPEHIAPNTRYNTNYYQQQQQFLDWKNNQKINGFNDNDINDDDDDYDDDNYDDDDDKQNNSLSNTIAGIAVKLLNDPKTQQLIVTAGTTLLNKFFANNTNHNQQLVMNTQINGIPSLSNEEVEKVVQCVTILKQVKPDVINDFIKLANIAQTDHVKTQSILNMLNMF